ncbi:phage tail protein [Paraburkholderia sp. Ac-20340]|uniref:phage tail protein n=1 Tax=Paraburkholderia sp. Ac-20340 TaxID=2703888 RepID=UPI00197D1DA5|nr:phage tail protein [Paraburkholderia sp. Ac-20340]
MASTFTWVPTVANFSGTATAKVRSAQFGDGYQQRAADGINNISSQFSLQFIANETDTRAIRAFLIAAAGADSFYWTPPLWDDPALFYCETWAEPTKDGDWYTMTATFQQTFDPGQDDSTTTG